MIAALLAVLTAPFVLFVYFGVRELPGRISIHTPVSPDVLEVLEGFASSVLMGSAFIVLACLVLAFFASGSISRQLLTPVREIIRGLNALSAGDKSIRIAISGVSELRELQDAFNQTAKAVVQLDTQLGQKAKHLEAMLDPVWVVDISGLITDINPAFTRVFGYDSGEAIGSEMFDFMDEETREVVRHRFMNSSEDEFIDLEGSLISRHTGLIPVLLSSSNLYHGGLVTSRVGIVKDFRTEQDLIMALREEKEHTDLLMDAIEDQLVVINRDFRIVRANRATRVLYGQSPIGLTCHSVLMARDERCYLHGMECPARDTFESGKPHSITRSMELSGEKTVHYDIHAFPVPDSSGEITSVLMSFRDVSQRMDFEGEIEHKNRELEAMNTISKVLSRSLRAEDTQREVLDRVIGLFSMDGGGIYMADDSGRKLNCAQCRGPSENFARSVQTMLVGQDIPGKVAESGRPAFFRDVSTDPRAKGSAFRNSGIKAIACAPIRGLEKTLGVFYMFSFSEREFSDSDERIMLSISEMMGISFENIRLYEKMRSLYRQDRDRRIQEQQDLLELSSMLASSLDMEKVLGSCMSLIKKSCWADFAWLLTFDTEGALRLKVSTDKEFEEGGVVYGPGASSIEDKAAHEQKPLMQRGIATNRKIKAHQRVRDFATVCSVPVYLGDRTLGAFSLYYIADVSLTDDEMHFLHIVGSVISVALERARLYESAIIQRGMANTILESIGDGVATVDPEGKVTSLNRAAEELLGHDAADAIGTEIVSLMAGGPENDEARVKLVSGMARAMDGDTLSVEIPFTGVGKKLIPLMLQCAPVFGKEAGAAGVVLVLRDMGRERELDMVMSEFVKLVSEEFRSPLASIAGMTEMLLDGDVKGKRKKQYLDNVLSESQRLSLMVEELLDLETMASGIVAFAPEKVDMLEALVHAEETMAPVAKSKRIVVSMDIDKNAASLMGDANLLKQLFRNLMENALAYSDPGAEVSVRATEDSGSVTITFADTGWGIKKEELSRVKEKFYRGSNSSKTTGTGLGLSLCSEIAALHGGSLDIKSAKGKGTTVIVILPKGS